MAEQMQEHVYIIPLRDARRMPRWKRANGAIKDIRKYLAKHMKTEDVKLDKTINEKVWSRGSEKPPSKIRVRAMKMEDGQVQAELAPES
ncbi:50S ribosomal protein L31e [Methanoregula sp.]|jgi:large subunit ribosomal protein L31e|uniref:50S ribosomal protein L31e n=1 Tax=Methanoregula sp. TaxID=2052170 RepID=UPI003BB11EAE